MWHMARNSEALPGSIEEILAAAVFQTSSPGAEDLHKICSHHSKWFCGRLREINPLHLFTTILAINQRGDFIRPSFTVEGRGGFDSLSKPDSQF